MTIVLGNLFPSLNPSLKTMVFVDGENLAIRYADELKNRRSQPIKQIKYEPNIYVWSDRFYGALHRGAQTIRIHYYTSVQGDEPKIESIIDTLHDFSIEQPSVFKKKPNGRSKQVDISLTTDMLLHAARGNYETAVLVAGDEDYVPLVKAVKAEGCRVLLWFISNGLSPVLVRNVDQYFNIDEYLFESDARLL